MTKVITTVEPFAGGLTRKAAKGDFPVDDDTGVALKLQNRKSYAYIESDFIDFGTVAEGVSAVAAGAGASNAGALADKSNHPGVWGLATGTTATGRVFIISASTRTLQVGGSGLTRVGAIVRTPATLSDAVNEYVLRAGLFSIALPNTINEGIGFEYQFNQAAGNWQGLCEDGIGETSVDLGIAVAVDTWYDLEFEINAAGTSVQFFINGVAAGAPVAANIPSGTGFALFVNIHIMKLAGLVSRSFYVDHYYCYQEVTR